MGVDKYSLTMLAQTSTTDGVDVIEQVMQSTNVRQGRCVRIQETHKLISPTCLRAGIVLVVI